MGLMNPFERDNNLKPKERTNQRAAWNIVSRNGNPCLCIVGYSESSDGLSQTQTMIFEPHHIEEFESIIKAWRQEQ